MTFFFDNHHPTAIVTELRERGVDAYNLRDVYFDQGVDDTEWIPEIARLGWVLITGDHHIRTKKTEKLAFQHARLITFFMAKEYNRQSHNRVAWVLSHWPEIEVAAATAQPGDCFVVPRKGKVRKLGGT